MDDKDKEKDITSTQKALSNSHDPGWNDPPKWAFSPTPNSSNTPTKRLLNKRVAFPLSSSPPTSNYDPNQPLTPPPVNLPPPPLAATAPHAPPVAQSSSTIESNGEKKTVTSKEETLQCTLKNLETVISEHEELHRREDELKKRLDAMKTAWVADKLNDTIHQRVFDISCALKCGDVEKADKIHISLMMDHAALCSAWIPGIRHLILELKGKSAQSNTSQEVSSGPYLLPITAAKAEK